MTESVPAYNASSVQSNIQCQSTKVARKVMNASLEFIYRIVSVVLKAQKNYNQSKNHGLRYFGN